MAIVCRDEQTPLRRFGIRGDGGGIIYTRTGRRFFENRELETQLLAIIRESMTGAVLWEELNSDWVCLDCELMPWSAKASELLRTQYAAVGSAARAAIADSIGPLEQAAGRAIGAESAETTALLQRQRDRLTRVTKYVDAYRQYCWPVRSISDLKLAPFHFLASEGAVHVDKDHAWHMNMAARLADAVAGTPLIKTEHRIVDVANPTEVEMGTAWWEAMTAAGGEGMVVKPLEFCVRGKKGLVQPAVKCRGAEYLRIIYGPEYDALDQPVARCAGRGLAAKRLAGIAGIRPRH